MIFELEPIECFPKDATSGHMHMKLQEGTLSDNEGKELGTIAFDPELAIVLRVKGRQYHISTKDIWEQMYKQLPD